MYLSMKILDNPELNDFNNYVPTKILKHSGGSVYVLDIWFGCAWHLLKNLGFYLNKNYVINGMSKYCFWFVLLQQKIK